METRQSELSRLLGELAKKLPAPHWVALVDDNGLVMACVPPDPPVEIESISAMTAAELIMGERVVGEIKGGMIRYVTVAGSNRQQITVVLSRDRLLSIGLDPGVSPHVVFEPLSESVQELAKALQRRFSAA